MSVARLDDHVARIGRDRPIRVPNIPLCVEDRVAADEEILLRTESQAGRAAELYRVGRFDRRGERIDAHHPAILRKGPDLRDGQEEPIEVGVPYRLLRAVARIDTVSGIKGDALADG